MESAEWAEAVAQAEAHIERCAAERRTTTYGELADAITVGNVRAYSYAMVALLSAACRVLDERFGVISASVVVRKDTGMPGEGYFAWAERSGFDVSDRRAFWERELQKVYERVG